MSRSHLKNHQARFRQGKNLMRSGAF